MIEKQREKEFLFELELICHNYNLVIISQHCADFALDAADRNSIDETTEVIENFIDSLRKETLEDVR